MYAGRDPSCGRRAAHRRGLSVPPRPGPARPGTARRAARGGGGAGRGDSAGGAKRGAGAGAAAATCAAANKVGRDWAGRDARCAGAEARWREGCCPPRRGDLSSRPPHDLTQSSAPLRSSVSQRNSGAAAPSVVTRSSDPQVRAPEIRGQSAPPAPLAAVSGPPWARQPVPTGPGVAQVPGGPES